MRHHNGSNQDNEDIARQKAWLSFICRVIQFDLFSINITVYHKGSITEREREQDKHQMKQKGWPIWVTMALETNEGTVNGL